MLRALDLFCGAGGASMGLHRAGFDVTGLDIKPQPHYPFRFVQGDALRPPFNLADFDFIWASPPCQHYTLANNRDVRGLHPDLVEAVRLMLQGGGTAWVIENVPHAPIRADVVLDGTMFPELKTIRRRHFECSFPAPFALGFNTTGLVGRRGWKTATGGGLSSHSRAARRRWGLPVHDATQDVAKAMGIDWMKSRPEISEAIPPAYAEYIARAWLAQRPATYRDISNREQAT